MDGAAFCRAYRERGGRAPVVLITAASEGAVADAVEACGADGSIAKPFEIDEVLSTIERLLPAPASSPTDLTDGTGH
jgi:CheY-like chemotaxis protein